MNQNYNQNKPGYPLLFSPSQIGCVKIKNRIVALPVHTGFAHTDGHASTWMTEFYRRLARSGTGLVVVANTAVSHDGIVSKYNLRADNDQFINGLKRLADAIKQEGAAACLQLNHAGRFAKTDRPLLPSPISSANLVFNVESLKEFMEFFPFEKRFGLTRYLIDRLKTWRQAMTAEDRERVLDDFSSAADRARQAGFDMVELHGANGYLLCQYLSLFTNKMASPFGGDLKRRASFPLEVIKSVKSRLPKGYPVGFRLILREWVPDGIDTSEAIFFAKMLEEAGIAYISASAGTYNSIFSPEIRKKMASPSYLESDMKKVRQAVGIPLISSGRITTPEHAERILKEGTADFAGLGRPIRTDPRWVKKARSLTGNINVCVNCNWCLKRVVLEQGFNCSRWPMLYRERTQLEHQLLTRNYKTLWVICGPRDINIFKNSWPLIDPDIKQRSYPTILFLNSYWMDENLETAQHEFIRWIKNRIDPLHLTPYPVNYTIHEDGVNFEGTVLREIKKGLHGQIMIASDQADPWRERLCYKQTGSVITLLRYNRHLKKVIIPIDFSPATLLVMIFLRKTLMEKAGFSFNFVHVATEPANIIEQKWEKFKKIARLDEMIGLDIIKTQLDIVSALTRVIRTEKYGTVIMGKRGLTGMKRWLLGSVTAGVQRKLTDQTLFLID